jgi:integrase
LEQARNEARKLAGTVAQGGDPRMEERARAQTEKAPTASRLVEMYTAALKAGSASSKRLRGRPPAIGYVTDTLFYLNLFARGCGRRPADSITRHDVAQSMAAYVGRPATQRNLHGAISRLYRWGQRQGLVTINPAEHVEAAIPPARERVLSLVELAAIWRAADALIPRYRDAVRLLMLTGQRCSEVAGMTWGEIDLTRALWTLPAARNKSRRQHTIPLPALAIELLQACYAALPEPPAPHDLVLPSRRSGNVPLPEWTPVKRSLEHAMSVAPWRFHDFRRSIVSLSAEHGADVAVLDTLLNHASSATRGGVIGVYQRATLIEPMRQVMALWNKLLATTLEPQVDVVPLRWVG